MDGRDKVYLSVFLEDDNVEVIGEVEVKNHTFSYLVINGIQWPHSRIKFFNFGERVIDTLSTTAAWDFGTGLNVLDKRTVSAPTTAVSWAVLADGYNAPLAGTKIISMNFCLRISSKKSKYVCQTLRGFKDKILLTFPNFTAYLFK